MIYKLVLLVLIIIFLNFVPFFIQSVKVHKKEVSNKPIIHKDLKEYYWFKDGIKNVNEYCLKNNSYQLSTKEMIHLYDIGGNYPGISETLNDWDLGVYNRFIRKHLDSGAWCRGKPSEDADYSIKNQYIIKWWLPQI